jgi:tRNA1(Val) A37 N6-methylase TrmN6
MVAETAPFTEDAFFGGSLLIRQRVDGHRIGTDAVLLAAASPASGVLADFGAGAGLVGLRLAQRGATSALLVEREPALAALAMENAHRNGLSDRVRVATFTIGGPPAACRAAGLLPDSLDVIATNPPFFAANEGRQTRDPLRAMAHAHQGADSLDGWIRTCATVLRPGGVLSLIHRASHLPELLRSVERRFGAIALRPVHPRAGAGATRIVMRAIKGSRAPLSLLPPLVLHVEPPVNAPTAEHRALADGAGLLSMEPGPVLIAGG